MAAKYSFSNWVRFDEREELSDQRCPGIYAIAISNKDIAGTSFEMIEEIAYFGMTNSKTGLRGRLDQFDNTLRDRNGPGHGGAERFRYDYPNGNTLAKHLYVAVSRFECSVLSNLPDDLRIMGNVARAEYLALADYAERFNRLPKYNDKKRSPKRPKHFRKPSIQNS